MSKDIFKEKLADPDMADMRQEIMKIVADTKNEIVSISHDNYGMEPSKITIVLRSPHE